MIIKLQTSIDYLKYIKIVINFINQEIEEDKNLHKEFSNHNDETIQLANEVYQNKINLTSK